MPEVARGFYQRVEPSASAAMEPLPTVRLARARLAAIDAIDAARAHTTPGSHGASANSGSGPPPPPLEGQPPAR